MATTNARRNRTTVADLAAAVALGTIDPTTIVALDDGTDDGTTAEPGATSSAPVALSATTHECGIAGCRHGAAHGATVQPDRQVKLQCPTCGAVARMTASALAKSGTITCGDGATFAPASRRTYVRKSA